jgi:hypothetical protein
MSTVPRLTTHSPGFVELVMRNSADVSAYRLRAANTLDLAFTTSTEMVTVARGTTYKSRTLRQKRLGTSIYTNRGLTFVQYDPEDFWVGGGNLPHDADTAYLVVEEQNAAGVFRPEGPILVIPPPGFFTTTRPALIVAGSAPNVAASPTGIPPAGALHFVLPRFADSTTVTNSDAATSLYISFGENSAEMEILYGQSVLLPDGAVSDVFIRGGGAAVTFSIFFAIVNAEMA